MLSDEFAVCDEMLQLHDAALFSEMCDNPKQLTV